MLLYILRHAWAEEPHDHLWPDDRLRPLTKDGIARFRQVASTLAERGCQPKLIGTSPLVRCRQTAELLAKALQPHPELIELPALAPGADVEELLAWSAGQQVDSLAWVGHAPDVGQLVAALISTDYAEVRFAKGAAAAIQFAGPPKLGSGTLLWHVTAKLLGC